MRRRSRRARSCAESSRPEESHARSTRRARARRALPGQIGGQALGTGDVAEETLRREWAEKTLLQECPCAMAAVDPVPEEQALVLPRVVDVLELAVRAVREARVR